MSYRYSAIKSVQYVSIALSSVTSNTATLPTAVDKNYSVIELLAVTTNSASNDVTIDGVGVDLTNGTTVTAHVNSANGSTRTAYVKVTEYFPHAMKQIVQHFSFNAATKTITAVGSKGAVFNGGFTSTSGPGTDNDILGGVDLTASTTVTRRNGAGAGTMYACVADFR